ncbi:acyl-CoA dehydrogenase family protein [Bradyrhizobium sp. WD16]|uniref:acyl-CoA dehydrogenase family protein n=1 Tax=Bradyrhizobium sp. WD16 TaxID=1521768 RepID=UPI0020A2420C|nr:acyl-CoA dehydrogenase family protein [Bradyrhizobium sp. WD16]UTD27365.1 acyl-CoA dehydrogenase [Bradyrhizobium sp. WD16]
MVTPYLVKSLQRSGETPGAVDIARRLAVNFAARAAEHDRDGSFPFANFAELAGAGLLALTVPAPLGGTGAAAREAAEVIGVIAQADPSTALVLTMHYIQHLLIAAGERYPAHLARRLAREAVDGRGLVNALRVEPDLGSPSRGGLPATVARRTSTGWRLNGHKIYCTGAPILDWYLVWARTDEEMPRTGQFLVPAGAAGARIVETWNHLGLRASGSHDVIFEDVDIPADHEVELRRPDSWLPADPLMTAVHALLLGAIYDGIARAARDWLTGFLNRRAPSSLGAPLATLPRAQEHVGEIETRLTINGRLLGSLAGEIDAGTSADPAAANIVKLAVTNNAVAAIETALTLTGNHGLSRANPLERHFRDVLCGRVHAPQDDAIRIGAGRLALGR